MTYQQHTAIGELVASLKIRTFHHGDCVGADKQAFDIVNANHTQWIVAHPCNLHELRAFTNSDEVREIKPPLDRNKGIVDATDILIVCPKEYDEQRRSGTWSTYRYAKKRRAEGKKQTIYLVLPNGQIENV